MRSRAREALPWEPVLSARTSAPVISFCNHVFIGVCSKLEEFHHRVVTILHLPRGQRLNIENTSDLDKLRADETGRVLSVETNVPMGTLGVSLRSLRANSRILQIREVLITSTEGNGKATKHFAEMCYLPYFPDTL